MTIAGVELVIYSWSSGFCDGMFMLIMLLFWNRHVYQLSHLFKFIVTELAILSDLGIVQSIMYILDFVKVIIFLFSKRKSDKILVFVILFPL